MLERQQEQHTVLAAGNADGDLVALVYHAVIVHGLADNAGKFIKCVYVHKMHLVIFKNENQNQAAFGSICEYLRVSEAQIKIGVDTASPLWYKSKARC